MSGGLVEFALLFRLPTLRVLGLWCLRCRLCARALGRRGFGGGFRLWGVMDRYVAFLRGMNVGGRRIKNPELCAVFEGMGFVGVSAFLASGNVVFEWDGGVDAGTVEDGLREALGYEVPVFLRSADQVRTVAGYEPFEGFDGERDGKLQVVLLSEVPSEEARDAVMALSGDRDMLEVVGREMYWWPKGNLSDSGLDLKAVEEVLGLFTVRTKATVERLAKRFLVG